MHNELLYTSIDFTDFADFPFLDLGILFCVIDIIYQYNVI